MRVSMAHSGAITLARGAVCLTDPKGLLVAEPDVTWMFHATAEPKSMS
jgi:hypothetical protein